MMRTPLRIGIGGPVGSGKTALVDALCKEMRGQYGLGVITKLTLDVHPAPIAPEAKTSAAATASARISFRTCLSPQSYDPECGSYHTAVAAI